LLDTLTEMVENNPCLWNIIFVSLQEHLLTTFSQSDIPEQNPKNILDDWNLQKNTNPDFT
jgi:hypothetical protein